ncbi:hypothetical protein D1Z97_09160 [Riemerella anatipestifer]|nr:hypothetical protein [Riemerella anatipestifer]MRN01336.1 hypothetical protein [Riemerella anatipestifer]MRN03373.1 hypothetical protein [Riemerella anatipestifer]
MDNRIEKLKDMQTSLLIDVVKNYKKYNLPNSSNISYNFSYFIERKWGDINYILFSITSFYWIIIFKL